jgi:drug/metabolite transporter (DMT)-like permease
MSFQVFLVIIVAAFLHAIWNAMVKYEKDKYLAVGAIVLGHVPASIVIIFLTPFPSVESIPYIIISAILHIGYEWNLLSAYRFGDFTKVYPIARGTGPTLVTIISLIFLGVVLSNFETLGILIICLGIFVLAFQDIDVLKNRKAVLYAFLTGFFIMSYSVIDGYGARASFSPLSYIGWSFILNAAIFPILLIYKNKARTILKIAKEGKKIFFIGGTISYMVYAIVVWSFTQAPIPLVVALRETSIIFALLIGFFVLKEKFTLLKTAAVLTIFFGVVLLKFM